MSDKKWFLEVEVNNKTYWKLVQLGAELQMSAANYVAMMASSELSAAEQAERRREKELIGL